MPARASRPRFDDSVFVNCPFDRRYMPLLHAVLFTVHDCGFVARHALEDVGGAESRFDKICRLVEASRWSIHDISRVELSRENRLPRFNMPFECGLAYGAARFGASGNRDILVMAAVPYQDKASLSDLSGMDPVYHHNDRLRLVAGVRRFLATKRSGTPTRSHDAIYRRLTAFETALPRSLGGTGTRLSTIASIEYVGDWVRLATAWMKAHPARTLHGASGK